jgi:hypothetical protein
MPPLPKIVYVDTNVIIEAVRTGCWKSIAQRFAIHTVATVRDEALKVPADKSRYVPVDASTIFRHVTVEMVSQADILLASAKTPNISALDAGERDLLAHVAARHDDAWIVTTADKAAVKTACALGLESKLVSLEELAEASGSKPKLHEWHLKRWLSKVRSEFLLDHF